MDKEAAGVDAESVVHEFLDYLDRKYGVSKADLNRLISKEKEELTVPVEILGNRKLGCMEAVVKFLRENMDLGYSRISELLGRSRSTIGVMYHTATRKLGERFSDYPTSNHQIPLSSFRQKRYTALEAVVMSLIERKLRVCQIAELLNRDYRTVYTIYRRGKRKNEA